MEKNDQGGGAASVAAALREHGSALARVCMALLGDAEGATRALERVAREAGEKGLPATGSVRVVLMGLAHRACTTQLSKMPARRSDEAPATERIGAAAEASELRGKLTKLKPTEREAVVLHLVGGLSADEVATACGTDAATAKTRISRGVALLIEEIEEEER